MTPILVMLATAFPIDDSVCVNLTSILKTNFYLQNHLLGVLKRPSLFDCAVSCQAHIECLSFGFEPRKRLCHLHTEEADASDDLVPKNPWIHGDISVLPRKFWGPCADHNCTAGQKCTTNRVTKQAVCVKGDIAQPETLCPVPPCLDNANISSGGRKPGDSRTYTCQDGYLDTESFLSSGVTICQSDLTWSPPNLTCSGPYIRKITRQPVESCQNGTFQKVIKDSKLVFFCKACINCYVSLCQDPQVSESECYYVSLFKDNILVSDVGGKNPLVIRKIGLLSCQEFRPFWITWLDGTLAVGNGSTVGSLEFGRKKLEIMMVINNLRIGRGLDNESTWLLLQQN